MAKSPIKAPSVGNYIVRQSEKPAESVYNVVGPGGSIHSTHSDLGTAHSFADALNHKNKPALGNSPKINSTSNTKI